MESVLSKLTYAGQASGISVDALSQQLTTNKAILDQLGYSLDEATAMFMNFELSGTNASAVMTGFRTALSKGDISSLDELNDVLGQIESGAMDAAEASDIFGRRAGPAIVNAAESGVFSLDTFSEGLENASGTLETTADAAQTLDQKWEQATGNISAAFTGALEPAVGGVSSKLADLTNDMGDFLNEHPTVTRAISATGIALGTVITGIVGVATATTLATTVVIPALVKIGTAAWAALGPFGMIAIAVAGVTAGIAAYAAMSDDAVDETDNLTVSSQNMARELDSMNAEYEETCRQFGDNSAEAVLLKDEIDDLSQTYEESKMTVEEFYESLSAQLDAHNEIVDSYTEQKDAMRDQGEQTNNLVAKLRELSEQTDVTTASQEQMESIVGKLQEMYPGLGISIDGVNGNLDKMVNKINAVTNATNAQTEYENAQKTYSALVSEQEDLIRARDEAQDIYNRACEQYLDANIMQESVWALTGGGAAGAMDEAKAKLDAANEAIDENIRLQEECTDSMQEYADMANGTSDEVVTAEDAVSVAIGKTQDRITALAEEYSKAYQSALDSIEGQYSLWDKVSNKVLNAKTSVTDFQEALKSQAEYWDNYSENLDKLQNRDVKGLDDVLASMNDGSEESAAALAGMAEASDAELAKIVRNFKKLQTAQDEAATNIAGISTNYDDELTKIQDSMDKTVENMAKEDEAATAAEKTIQSYINKIRNMQGSVSAAASYVANAAARALTKNAPEPTTESDTTATATPAPAHANGTTNAERLFIAGEAGPELIVSKAAAYANGTTDSDDYYIAGEKGPELIIGQQGSTVFPAGETERIINAIGERQPVNVFGPSSGGGDRSSASEKHILLEIAGSGAIDIKGSGMDKEGILEIVQNHLKPILMNIIQQEVYEEGDLSYEY